ncbi:MAG: sialate O-acetylesterase [Imperialibacter sp.]|uniref:sialate O-acetylesterase n=1 Tax=Imperialibacter sp. TaxID=2038411 RepID=UPI0032F08C1C
MTERHRHRIIVAVCLAACMVLVGQAMAQLSCAQLFSDNMVLQRGIEMNVWGTSAAGEKISVKLDGFKSSALADEHGKWEIKLPAHGAGGPYQLEVEGLDEKLAFTNVLVGDVWFASGQSNMEHPMAGWPWIPRSEVKDYEKEIADIDYSNIRLFNVPKMPMPVAAADFEASAWEMPSVESVARFSSTAWFFAKELNRELDVPIGIIHSSWGGTPIRSWMSPESMVIFKDSIDIPPAATAFDKDEWMGTVTESMTNNLARRMAISFPRAGEVEAYASVSYDASSWSSINPLDTDIVFGNVVWLRKGFQVPEKLVRHPLRLSLGFLSRESRIFLNGVELDLFSYPQPVLTDIPAHLVNAGENMLTVRLAQPFGTPKFFGEEKSFFIENSNRSFSVNLAREWLLKNDFDDDFGPVKNFHNSPSSLFNGMVAPATPYGIKGFIWYQGESNASRPELYAQMFPELIRNWRTHWGLGDLPFLFVQLSNLELTHEFHKMNSSWSNLRAAQQNTLALPNTGMAVSLDIGNPYNIHPANKQDFGDRLALQAMDIAYDKPVVANGPSYTSFSVEGNTVVVRFGEAIKLRKNAVGFGASFEVAGEDGSFVKATGKVKRNNLHISSSEVSQPKAVRFDWSNNPEYYIINKAGLPASPFLLELNK